MTDADLVTDEVVVAAEFDGGDLDCGGGLLLLLTRNLRRVEPGEVLAVHTLEPSVPADLEDWARLAGHTVIDSVIEGEGWTVRVRRGGASKVDPFSSGPATPLGERLWMYTNFHCNLSCSYCCADSSPQAPARLLPVAVAAAAADEFVALGGCEVVLTGGEPFLHPEIGTLVAEVSQRAPVVILTNAMVFQKGARRAALESMDRERVTLQISLDSADPGLHDANRGAGSHARAVAGIGLARSLGFRVKVAATLDERATSSTAALHARLDEFGIPTEDRLIRPIAQQGAADYGVPVTIDEVAPEPTLTADGIWWHPVAITDTRLKVADHPLPLAEAFGTIRDAVEVQDAARQAGRRHVFRCA
ncbi:MAG: radical SAM protein [Candidatus Nanopelagicales bacterium]